jgi:hypothetical protein
MYTGRTQPVKLVNNAALQRTVNAVDARRSTDYERCERLPECTFYFVRHKRHIGVLVALLETSGHIGVRVTSLETSDHIGVRVTSLETSGHISVPLTTIQTSGHIFVLATYCRNTSGSCSQPNLFSPYPGILYMYDSF